MRFHSFTALQLCSTSEGNLSRCRAGLQPERANSLQNPSAGTEAKHFRNLLTRCAFQSPLSNFAKLFLFGSPKCSFRDSLRDVSDVQ